ncbi:hypothetical protein FJTKL_09073 [Diaporthe vaccinii]
MNGVLGAQSRGRDTSEPLSSNEEAEASFGADTFTTTLFSGTPADVSEKTWWLFHALARESTTGFRPSPSAAAFQLPLPPWSPSRSGRAPSDASTTQQTSTGQIQVPLLHFKQDAFNYIKRHLGGPFLETGDSVMATISCLLLLEAASWETNPDALSAVVMHLNGLITAANHHWGPMVTTELTILQKFLGMAIGCVTRNDVQEQLSSMVSSVNQSTLRGVLFMGLSSKPTDAWWCVDKNKSAQSNCGPANLLRSTRGQQQDPGSASARMIAYMYLSLVLRPGRMSNEILECLVDSVSTDTDGFERRAMDDSAEQAALFWSLMLSRAAMASITPLSGSGPEKLYWKQRLIDQNIRSASRLLQLQTWPEAVTVLGTVAFAEFEGEQELKSMWERAVSDVD